MGTELERIVSLRWASLAAYLVVWLLGAYLLKASYLQPPIILIAAILFSSNLLLVLGDFKPANWLLVATIFLDLSLLQIFLYFYGGYANPFAMMFLVYVSIASLLVSALWTWIVFAVSSILYITLFFWHITIPAFSAAGHSHHVHEGFSAHLYGMLISYLVTGALITFFLTKMRSKLDQRQNELLRLQQITIQQQSLARISALTAQSAHELSTPLASMSLIAESLSDEDLSQPENISQINLLKNLIEKCRKILINIRERFEASADEPAVDCKIAELIISAVGRIKPYYPNQNPVVNINSQCEKLELRIPKTGAILSLSSLIDNAAKYGKGLEQVTIECSLAGNNIVIKILDQNDRQIDLSEINEMKPNFLSNTGFTGKFSGLGVGIYLTRLFLDSIDAKLNYYSYDKGTCAQVTIPYGK